MSDDDIFDRLRAARALRKVADAQVRAIVNEAFESGHTWQEIAECLGVSRARVYQIRNGTR
jgi:DNA-directed RNA polymerase specialized sigma subunit